MTDADEQVEFRYIITAHNGWIRWWGVCREVCWPLERLGEQTLIKRTITRRGAEKALTSMSEDHSCVSPSTGKEINS